MRPETWLADEVEVNVSGVFTTHHVLQTGTGTLGELTMPALKMASVFRAADGQKLIVKRTSWWRGTYELREDDTVLGTARPMGLFRRENAVQFGEQAYRLRAAGFCGRIWHLLDSAGETVMEIRPRGAFRRGAILRIRKSVDLTLLAFTYGLVQASWQEQTAAAGAGGAAGS